MWSDLAESGPGMPDAAADPLRTMILGGLAYAALTCRDSGPRPGCRACGEEPCPDHAPDPDLADRFENAYMQVAYGSAAWCDLAVKLISEMN